MDTRIEYRPPAGQPANALDIDSPREVEFATVSGTSEFEALQEEWDELYDSCPSATPFQSWAWLYSWWQAYGDLYLLRIITLRDSEDGSLVGILPLMAEMKSPYRILFIGTGLSDYLDVLLREGYEKEAASTGGQAVGSLCRFRVADLQQLRPDAAAWDMFEGWSRSKVTLWQESCPVVELRPWEDLVSSLSRNNRSVVRRNIKRFASDGASRELAGVERAEEAASALVALHREMWGGRGISAEHLSERFERCLRAAARRMSEQGIGGISEFRSGEGEVIGADFLIFGKETIGSYVQGARKAALKRYQLSSIYIWDAVNISDGRFASFDWMRGEEEYKLRWSPTLIPNHRLILGRSSVLWAPYASYQLLRSRAKSYIYYGDASERMVTAAKRLNSAAKRLKEWQPSRRKAPAHEKEKP